jgi:hypothetical protein
MNATNIIIYLHNCFFLEFYFLAKIRVLSGVPVVEEHLWNRRCIVSRELLATSSQGLCFNPCLPPRMGDRGHHMELQKAGMASSPVRISTYDRLSQPGVRSKPQIHQQSRQGTLMNSPNNTQKIHAVGAVMMMRGTTLVLKGLAQRCLEAPCMTLVSQGIFKRWATSLSMMVKPTLVSSWRTTASRAERVEQTMFSSSSSSSQPI